MCLSNEVCAFGLMCLSNKVCAFANHRKKHINPNWDEWKFVTFKKIEKPLSTQMLIVELLLLFLYFYLIFFLNLRTNTLTRYQRKSNSGINLLNLGIILLNENKRNWKQKVIQC